MENMAREWLFNPTVGKLVTVFIGIVLVIVVVRFAKKSTSRYIKESDTRYRVRKFITFVGYLIGILFVSVVFSDKLGGLTVALGVAGAGIAFALQEVIASIAGWFAVTFSNFFKTGDRVQLGGIKGDVIDIGILRTTLMEVGEWVKGDLYSGRVVRIANSFIFKEPLFNYSGDFPFLWDEIVIPVKYGSDMHFARTLFEKITEALVGDYARKAEVAWKDMVKKYLIEDASVEPTVTMTADENWMIFTIRYVVDYKKRRSTKDALFSRILADIDASQGRVVIAGASIEIVDGSMLNVKMTEKT